MATTRKFRASRRAIAVKAVGGACVYCGRTDGIEFDHVQRAGKALEIMGDVSVRFDRWFAELAKVQPLCKGHHTAKTAIENRRTAANDVRA